jgi:hypothetical protein
LKIEQKLKENNMRNKDLTHIFGGMLAIIFLFSVCRVQAQESELKPNSFVAYPMPVLHNKKMDETQIKVVMNFQLPTLAKAKKLYFLLGSEMNTKNVSELTATISSDNGSFFLTVNGSTHPVSEIDVNAEVILTTEQFKQTYFVTLIVEDASGKKTLPLHARLHN